MKFAHLADVHLGAWRHPKLSVLPQQYFDRAVMIALERNVDFIVIAGDLFDSALPGIDHLKRAVRTLNKAKVRGVPVYVVPGSHDYSSTGKSMIDVLEEAELLVNVYKGEVVDGKLRLSVTVDTKTGVQVAGMMGRKGSLETHEYEGLDREWLESTITNDSVFVFHTAITELKPPALSTMSSQPASMLPRGFTYYAGGHVHITGEVSLPGYERIVYPGPVFPASFSELEELKGGRMVIFDDGVVERVDLCEKEVVCVNVTIEGSPLEVTEAIIKGLAGIDNKIVLLRVQGRLVRGTLQDVDFLRIYNHASTAYALLKNTSGLVFEREEQGEQIEGSASQIEERVLLLRAGSVHNPFGEEEYSVMQGLLTTLSQEKGEGQTNASFEETLTLEVKKRLGIE